MSVLKRHLLCILSLAGLVAAFGLTARLEIFHPLSIRNGEAPLHTVHRTDKTPHVCPWTAPETPTECIHSTTTVDEIPVPVHPGLQGGVVASFVEPRLQLWKCYFEYYRLRAPPSLLC